MTKRKPSTFKVNSRNRQTGETTEHSFYVLDPDEACSKARDAVMLTHGITEEQYETDWLVTRVQSSKPGDGAVPALA